MYKLQGIEKCTKNDFFKRKRANLPRCIISDNSKESFVIFNVLKKTAYSELLFDNSLRTFYLFFLKAIYFKT